MLEPFLPLVCSESWRALGKLVKWEAGLWCSQPLTFASFPLFCEILLFLGHRMPWLLRSYSQAKIQYHPSQSISFLKHIWSLIVESKLFFPLPDAGSRRLVGEIFKTFFFLRMYVPLESHHMDSAFGLGVTSPGVTSISFSWNHRPTHLSQFSSRVVRQFGADLTYKLTLF